jgi:hypothetical protein
MHLSQVYQPGACVKDSKKVPAGSRMWAPEDGIETAASRTVGIDAPLCIVNGGRNLTGFRPTRS